MTNPTAEGAHASEYFEHFLKKWISMMDADLRQEFLDDSYDLVTKVLNATKAEVLDIIKEVRDAKE